MCRSLVDSSSFRLTKISGVALALVAVGLSMQNANSESLCRNGTYVLSQVQSSAGKGLGLRSNDSRFHVSRLERSESLVVKERGNGLALASEDRSEWVPCREVLEKCGEVQKSLGVSSAACEPDYAFRLHRTPNDPYYLNYQSSLAHIGAAQMWDTVTGSSNLIIGVTDSGADVQHVDLAANIWRNSGEVANNGVDDDGNGYVDDIHGFNFVTSTNNIADDQGHGTGTASVIAAIGNNSIGMTGVLWTAKVIPLKVCSSSGTCSVLALSQAYEYLVRLKRRGERVAIVNSSLGGAEDPSYLRDAVRSLNDAGILLVAAAGNESANNDVVASYPADYEFPNVLSVAATDQAGGLASFSNYGAQSVHVAAPGVDILTLYPGNQITQQSGTSFSAPIVAGAAGAVSLACPLLNASSIREQIIRTVNTSPALTGKLVSNGELNAARAVSSCLTPTPSPIPTPTRTPTPTATPNRTPTVAPTPTTVGQPTSTPFPTSTPTKAPTEVVVQPTPTAATTPVIELPISISLKAKKLSDGRVRVSWSSNPFATEYIVRRVDARKRSLTKFWTKKNTSLTDGSVKRGKKYEYQVISSLLGIPLSKSKPVVIAVK